MKFYKADVLWGSVTEVEAESFGGFTITIGGLRYKRVGHNEAYFKTEKEAYEFLLRCLNRNLKYFEERVEETKKEIERLTDKLEKL